MITFSLKISAPYQRPSRTNTTSTHPIIIDLFYSIDDSFLFNIIRPIDNAGKLLHDEVTEGRTKDGYQNGSSLAVVGYQFLECFLRHTSEMVIFEAARSICSLPRAEAQDLNPAINVL